jgi:hypothetical protein
VPHLWNEYALPLKFHLQRHKLADHKPVKCFKCGGLADSAQAIAKNHVCSNTPRFKKYKATLKSVEDMESKIIPNFPATDRKENEFVYHRFYRAHKNDKLRNVDYTETVELTNVHLKFIKNLNSLKRRDKIKAVHDDLLPIDYQLDIEFARGNAQEKFELGHSTPHQFGGEKLLDNLFIELKANNHTVRMRVVSLVLHFTRKGFKTSIIDGRLANSQIPKGMRQEKVEGVEKECPTESFDDFAPACYTILTASNEKELHRVWLLYSNVEAAGITSARNPTGQMTPQQLWLDIHKLCGKPDIIRRASGYSFPDPVDAPPIKYENTLFGIEGVCRDIKFGDPTLPYNWNAVKGRKTPRRRGGQSKVSIIIIGVVLAHVLTGANFFTCESNFIVLSLD